MSGFEKRPLLCNGVFGCHGNIYYVILIGAVLCDTYICIGPINVCITNFEINRYKNAKIVCFV